MDVGRLPRRPTHFALWASGIVWLAGDDIAGKDIYGTLKDFVLLAVPPALVTAILPVFAPAGTVTLM